MTVGSRLQHTRMEQKLSLTEVTEKTKIQPWVLEALEADRLPQMMSPIYVKGFLTTYARFLHLEPEPLIAQLEWPQPHAEPEALPPPAQPIRLDFSGVLPRLRRAIPALAVTAALVAVVLLHPLRWLPRLSLSGATRPALASVTTVKELAPLKTPAPTPLALVPIAHHPGQPFFQEQAALLDLTGRRFGRQ